MMEITIPVPVMRRALTGISRLNLSKQQYAITFKPMDGCLNILASNWREFVSFRAPDATFNGEGSFAVEFDDLKALVNGARGDTLALKQENKTVTAGYSDDLWQAEIELEAQEGQGMLLDAFKGYKPVAVPDFRSNFMFALPYASLDETRAMLCGVCLHRDGSIVATDGRRLVFKEKAHPLSFDKMDILIPNTSWTRWSGAGEVKGIGAKECGDVYLETPEWRYVGKTVSGTYPNYRQVVPSPTPETYYEMGDDAIIAFRTVELLSDRKQRWNTTVRLECSKTRLSLQYRNHRQHRKVKISMQGSGTFQRVTGINCLYFIDALRSGFRKFYQEDDLSPSVSTHNGWTHVLMPMRINEND